MATPAEVRDRLQPALIDRLTDESPTERAEAEDHRVMSKTQLRRAVLRDLGWLLNSVQPLSELEGSLPSLAKSVLNFGLPPISGQLASKIDISMLERSISQAILRYEPRILPETLKVLRWNRAAYSTPTTRSSSRSGATSGRNLCHWKSCFAPSWIWRLARSKFATP